MLWEYLNTKKCNYLKQFYSSQFSIYLFYFRLTKQSKPNQTQFKCNHTPNITSPMNFKQMSSGDYDICYNYSNEASQSFPSECSTIQLPVHLSNRDEQKITAEFYLEVHVSDACSSCYSRGGLCELDNKGKFHCSIIEKGIDIGITQKKFGPTVTH